MAEGEGVFTNIDAFVKYLNEHGETEASVIASGLGVTDRNVEEWAKILENSKMAKITYKLGRMYVAPISAGEAAKPEAKQMVEVKKTIVSGEVESQLADLSKLTQRIEEFNRAAATAQGILDKNAGEVKDVLNKMGKLQAEADASFNGIKSKKDEIEKFSQELGGMLGNLSGGTLLAGVDENRNKAKAIIEDLEGKVKAYQEGIANLLKNYDAGVRNQRNQIVEFSKNAKEEIQVVGDLIKDEERDLQKYDSSYKNYTNESAKIKNVVDKNKAEMVDSIAKAQSQIESVYQLADERKKRLEAIIASAREGMSSFEEFSGKLAEIREGIAQAAKENEEVRKELEQLEQQLRAADAMSKQRTDEKKELTSKVEKSSAKTAAKLAEQKEKAKRLKDKLDDLNR